MGFSQSRNQNFPHSSVIFSSTMIFFCNWQLHFQISILIESFIWKVTLMMFEFIMFQTNNTSWKLNNMSQSLELSQLVSVDVSSSWRGKVVSGKFFFMCGGRQHNKSTWTWSTSTIKLTKSVDDRLFEFR